MNVRPFPGAPQVRTMVEGRCLILIDGCPYCREQHAHGHEGKGMAYEGGHRGAHCGDLRPRHPEFDNGYWLLPPEGVLP